MSNPRLWQPADYQLLDFGHGRKLERFGPIVLDRPCPAAEHKRPAAPASWEQADVRIGVGDEAQQLRQPLPADWHVAYERITLHLRLTAFGHVGLFPEHALNWRWLADRNPAEAIAPHTSPPRALNLFAYTGGATLHLASRGWEVVHVDAAAPSVAWARVNAQLSGLAAAPIRWIVDDARAFVARELRRGKRYDAILLDPPSYGHGPKGRKTWQIERDLTPLLADCAQLLTPESGCLVLTGHSEDIDGDSTDLPKLFFDVGRRPTEVESGRLSLQDATGRKLDCGWFARAT